MGKSKRLILESVTSVVILVVVISTNVDSSYSFILSLQINLITRFRFAGYYNFVSRVSLSCNSPVYVYVYIFPWKLMKFTPHTMSTLVFHVLEYFACFNRVTRKVKCKAVRSHLSWARQ